MVINPLVGVYIPSLRIPIKGAMTIPTFNDGTYACCCLSIPHWCNWYCNQSPVMKTRFTGLYYSTFIGYSYNQSINTYVCIYIYIYPFLFRCFKIYIYIHTPLSSSPFWRNPFLFIKTHTHTIKFITFFEETQAIWWCFFPIEWDVRCSQEPPTYQKVLLWELIGGSDGTATATGGGGRPVLLGGGEFFGMFWAKNVSGFFNI